MPPSPTNPLASFISAASAAAENTLNSVGNVVTKTHDEALQATTQKVLDSVGPGIFRYIEDPYCPQPLKGLFASVYTRSWDEIQVELREQTMQSYGWADVHYDARKHRLDHWPLKPGLFKCCNARYGCCGGIRHFGRVLRARFLYADQPADGSTWSVLRDPLGLLVFLLKLNMTTSVATFALLFVLMDRRDEAQLVLFILKFKTFMFLTAGLLPAATLGAKTHACLAAIEAGAPRECIDNAASSSEWFPLSFASELVRLGLIWLAFAYLVCGHAVGGDAEIAALEQQRLLNSPAKVAVAPSPAKQANERGGAAAAADGYLVLPSGQSGASPAATVAPLSLRSSAAEPKEGSAAASPGEAFVPSPRVQDPSEVHEQLEASRSQWGAQRRVGGVLPYFLAYDVLALLSVVGSWLVLYVWPRSCGGYTMPFTSPYAADGSLALEQLEWIGFVGCGPIDTTSPLFWSSIYNLKMCYALLCL